MEMLNTAWEENLFKNFLASEKATAETQNQLYKVDIR